MFRNYRDNNVKYPVNLSRLINTIKNKFELVPDITTNLNPLYVIEIDKTNNLIVLGEKKHLEKTEVQIKDINWFADNIDTHDSIRCSARIRSTQDETPGTLKIKGNEATYIFDKKIASTSPGQACVFYLKNQVLGGGWITKRY